MKQYIRTFIVTNLILFTHLSRAEAADPQVSPYAGAPGWAETKEERMEWFEDAKFGMFIHWGLYAPAGGYWPPDPDNGTKYGQKYSEWIRNWANVSEPEYGDMTKPLFKPAPGCTDGWAKLARDAGMKYAVLTTKHHDGYTLFNAKAPYSQKNDITGSTNISPKGRDMVAEYADSMRKQGLKVGYYYSIIDWQHPHAVPQSRGWPITPGTDHSEYVEYMHQHMKQLFSDYGKSDIMWVDYSSQQFQGSAWKTREVLEDLRKLQPHAVVNNRFWNGLENGNGDFFTPEKYIPPTGFPGRTFEVCHTMNESFGYSHHDKHWKSAQDVVHMLVDIVSKGGNLLLNVGPDAQGHIPKESVDALRETGKWLKVHGESVYGTQASPFADLPFDGRCTSRTLKDGNTRLYFHILNWPENGQIELPWFTNRVGRAALMGSVANPVVESNDQDMVIKLPKQAPNKISSVVVLNVNGSLTEDALEGLPQQKEDRSVVIKALKAEVSGPHIHIQARKGKNPAHVSHWFRSEAFVTLKFDINSPGPVQAGGMVTHQPGRYAVYANYATEKQSGGKLRLTTVNSQSFEIDIPPTGGWDKYQRKKLGEITLTAAGETEIKLESLEIAGAGFMNLESLELIPQD